MKITKKYVEDQVAELNNSLGLQERQPGSYALKNADGRVGGYHFTKANPRGGYIDVHYTDTLTEMYHFLLGVQLGISMA
jgi:hypothetical protein